MAIGEGERNGGDGGEEVRVFAACGLHKLATRTQGRSDGVVIMSIHKGKSGARGESGGSEEGRVVLPYIVEVIIIRNIMFFDKEVTTKRVAPAHCNVRPTQTQQEGQ